jgi:hypothetical protein
MYRSRTVSSRVVSAAPPALARCVVLVAAVATSGVAVWWLAAPWLAVPWLAGPRPAGAAFADQVATACAGSLVLCWAWLALGTVLVALQALRPGSAFAQVRLRWVPATIRVLVPVAVGMVATATPAGALAPAADRAAGSDTTAPVVGARAVPAGLTGLPLPDRPATASTAAAAPTGAAAPPRTVRVRPGDSLWLITERLLPAGASTADVDHGWRRLARANRTVLDDPDLVRPGTRLRVPPLPTRPREDTR